MSVDLSAVFDTIKNLFEDEEAKDKLARYLDTIEATMQKKQMIIDHY